MRTVNQIFIIDRGHGGNIHRNNNNFLYKAVRMPEFVPSIPSRSQLPVSFGILVLTFVSHMYTFTVSG